MAHIAELMHVCLGPLWSALPLLRGSYSVQFAHEETEAQIGQ